MFTVKANVYADERGQATHEPGKGRTLILARGAVVSDKQADELGLRELGRALDKAAVKAAWEANAPMAAAKAAKAKDESRGESKGESGAVASTPPAGDAPKGDAKK